MQRYYTLVIFAIFLNLSAAKADQFRDSIGVENLNGKKLILHKIAAKDTYYSLGRRYGVIPKDIMTYNNNKFLQIGVLVKVPTQIPFDENNSAKPTDQPSADPAGGNTETIEHTVQRKENLNMLAEKYGTTVDEIKRVSNLNSINLQIGQILRIPVKPEIAGKTAAVTAPAATVTNPPANVAVPATATPPVTVPATAPNSPVTAQPQGNEELIVHTVASNETMYSIASKYGLTLDQLKAKNNLSANSLYVGQKLLVRGQYPIKDTSNEVANKTIDTLESVNNPSLKLPPSSYGLSQLDEKGTGTWIVDPDLDPSKMLVLHRTAPVGTIMKITNPMSNRSTFAKVVGKFTENESTKDIIIVMTKAVADALGALDKRFLCNLTYSGQANEQ